MKHLFRLILLVSIGLMTKFSFGAHLVGTEARYECNGGNNYTLHFSLYMEPSGLDWDAGGNAEVDDTVVVAIYDLDNTTNWYDMIEIGRATIDTIYTTYVAPCTGTTYEDSIYKWNFTKSITLPANTNGYRISYWRCCRPNGYSNVSNGQGIGIDLNIPATGCNNMPEFNSTFPRFICQNSLFEIDASVTDVDGDSLVYSLTAPYAVGSTTSTAEGILEDNAYWQNMYDTYNNAIYLTYIETNATYVPPFDTIDYEYITFPTKYSGNNPFGSGTISINSAGLITGQATDIGSNFVVAVKVQEYRNGVLLSELIRDIPISIIDCGSLIAQGSNANLSSENFTCGDSVPFNNLSLNANKYKWDFGVTAASDDTSNLENPIFHYPDTGNYTVTLIAFDTTLANCSDTFTQDLDIVKAVITDFSYLTLCDSSTSLNSIVEHDSTGLITSFSWDINNGGASYSTEDVTHTFSTTGNHSIEFITRDVYGCADTTDSTINVIIPNINTTLTNDAVADAICDGDSITFTAGGGTNYNFLLNGISVQDSTSTTYSHGNITNNAQVSVVVSDGSGCLDTSAITTITVNSLPTAIHTNSTANDSVCFGEGITFTGSGGVNYDFHINHASIQNSATDNWTAGFIRDQDIYYVVVTDANNCTDTSNIDTITVIPIPDITLTNDATDNTTCPGGTITFTGNNGTTYDFHVNDVSQQSGTTSTYADNGLAQNDIVYVVGTQLGCSDTSNYDTINISSSITAGLTNSGNANNVCTDENVTFTATGGDNFVFQLNGTEVQNSASNLYTNNSLNDNDIIKVIVSSGACTDSTTNTITVNGNPTGTLTDDNPNDTSCQQTPIEFTAGGGANYYFLINGTDSIQNSASNTVTTSILENGDSMTVIVSNGNNCSDTVTIGTYTINDLPSISLTTTDSSICSDELSLFTASGGTNYNFHLNDASQQDGSTTTYTPATPANNDAVYVVVTDANNCTDTSTTITIDVTTAPTANLTSDAPSNTSCNGGLITFTENDGLGDTYLFYVDDVLVQNSATDNFISSTITNGQEIKVIVNTNAGCSAEDSLTMSINAIAGTLTPSDGDLSICENEIVSFTASGGTDYQFKINGATVNTSTTFNTSSLNNGDIVSVIITDSVSSCTDSIALSPFTVNQYDDAIFQYDGPQFCASDFTVPTQNDPTVGGTWSASPAGLDINSANGSIDLSNSAVGNYVVKFTSGGLCPDLDSNFLEVMDALTEPITEGDKSICNKNAIPISANAITVGAGSWNIISGSGSVLSPSSPNTTVFNLTPGETIVLEWSAQNGVCPSRRDTMTITNNNTPEIVSAGNDIYCYNDTLILNALAPSIEFSGTWSTDDIDVTIDDPSNPTTFVTGLTPNTPVTFTWSVVDSTCGHDSSDQVIFSNQYSTASIVAADDSTKILVPTSFTVDTSDLTTIEWFIDGESQGSTTPLSTTFLRPFHHQIKAIGTDENGCPFEDTIAHKAFDFDWIFVPNFFTPNGDGNNDQVAPMGYLIDKENFVFSVYDRWGNKVFEATQAHQYWDGTDQNSGKPCVNDGYSWYASYIDENGAEQIEEGFIILFR